jgi:hypothetical protein
MADVTISQLSLVAPKGDSFILLSQDNVTVRTLASSLTANCLPVGSRYSVEYLLVGGGGGGGQDYGGGGGAGGLLEGEFVVDKNIKYNISVGYFGREAGSGQPSSNGGPSSLGPLMVFGGGRGGDNNRVEGGDGGSGGGAKAGYTTFGRGLLGQGNNGNPESTGGYGGGGGGAGGPASQRIGGAGKSSSITGTAVIYASGGTTYNTQTSAPDKSPNTGHGGDGSLGPWGYCGSGGSGVVVIAYEGTPRGTAYLYDNTVIPADTSSRPGYTVHKFLQGGYYIA